MTGRYKAYAEYKDSGVEWIGSIPTHWGLKKLKYLAPLIGEKATEKTNPIALEHIQSWTGKLISSDSTFEGDGTKFKAGDILFGKLRPYLAKVYLTKADGEAIGDFHVMRPISNSYGKFLKSLMLTKDYIATVDASTYGAKMPRASWDFTSNIQLPFCSEVEAEKIANFLDHETAKIDTLIDKQEKLIELLKEKRQAVISHAVTKGLNPDVPMKDSGVEWLGDVPEHWVVTSIKRELKSLDSRRIPLSADERGKRTGEYRYYGASGVIDFIDDYIFDEPTVLVGEDGANLLNRNTPLAFSAHGQYWVNNHAHILSPLDGLVDYWAEVIEIIDVTPIVSGSAQPKLTAEALNNLKISFPASLEERQTIEKFICIQQSKYDQLMRKAKNQVELLKERKTALISAAVTGKIDVRDWQEPTYQESA
ncbi:restriction endonuclease subunit S [Vibrio parahaemolyticus]